MLTACYGDRHLLAVSASNRGWRSLETNEISIETERIRSVLQQAPLTLSVTVLNAILTGFVLAPVTKPNVVWTWVTLNILISAVRLVLRQRFFRRGSDKRPGHAWAAFSLAGSLATGLLWGAGAAVMFPASETYQLFLAFVIGGMCAGAVSVNSAHWPTAIAFIVPATLPLAGSFCIEGTTPRIVSALMIGLFAGALSLTSWRSHRGFGDRMRLQIALTREKSNLGRANDQLREEITQRQKAEAVSVQAQKMEAMGHLTGGIAHDFNNLLQSMAGSLELIRDQPENRGRVQRLAEVGLHAAARGAKLTNQLLAFSRSQRLEQKPIAVSKLLSDTHHLLERTLGPTIRIRLDPGATNLRLIGDETQLEMALLNLAINARDAMPKGGELMITARAYREEGRAQLTAGDYVEISVTDTGSGMPPEVIARAFDPFFTTKGVGQGSGLGLSQVYGTVRQSNGAIFIDSQVGLGTTVRMFLKRTEDAVAIQRDRIEATISSDGAATILVVDDDPDVRQLLVASLDALGFTPLEAEDGYAGIAALHRSKPAAMILDFAMPGINGAEVARQARAQQPDLPIIFVTGYSDTAAIEAAVGASTPVLRKPFRIDELRLALRSALAAA